MERVSSAIIIFVLLFNLNIPRFAEPMAVVEPVAEEVMVVMMLSLQEAIDYALLNSKEMEIQRIELAKSEVQYTQNKRAVRSTEDFHDMDINIPRTYEVTTDDNVNRSMIKNGVSLRQVELAWNIANWNLTKKENQIKYNVEKAYFDLKKSENELIIANENLALSQKQFDFGKLRLDVGLMSKQQVLGLEIGRASCRERV